MRDPQSVHILVVDDDPDLRDSIAAVLEAEGYVTHSASSGREALTILRGGEHFDLVLLDLMMPDLSGWQFTEVTRSDPALYGTHVLIVTAARDGRLASLGYEVLLKPFRIGDLLESVRRLTAKAESGTDATPAV